MRSSRNHSEKLIGAAACLIVGLALSGTFSPRQAVASYDSGYGYSGSTSSSTPAQSGGKTVEVRLSEWSLGFDRVTVASGKTSFRIVNDGSYEHVFEIEGNGIERKTARLASGESATLTVTLQPGEYEVYCPVPGHEPRGMVGKIIVQG